MSYKLLVHALAVAILGGAAAQPAAATDPKTALAQHRYLDEVEGSIAHGTLARLANDSGLIAALRSGNRARLRSYVAAEYRPVWYHWHVSFMRIARGSTTLAEAGVPFVVPGPQRTLRDHAGHAIATLQISVQDVIGFVRLNKRLDGLDTVVRGRGASHVRTSLPAALSVHLPGQGSVTISGRRYKVTSFAEKAWGDEPVRVWILQRR
jgi:hypothetical protein